MNSVQDVKSTSRNQLCFDTLTMKYLKKKHTKQHHLKQHQNQILSKKFNQGRKRAIH